MMKESNVNNDPPKDQNADYNPMAHDFQRTEKETDAVSKSENEHEEENRRTDRGNTTPNKNKIN